ncbi:MAG: AMP-binding protein [Planctomycetota bacterium]|jgi:fatty-acyl-CoA synthase
MQSQPLAYVHRGGERPLISSCIDAFLSQVTRAHASRPAVISPPEQRRLSYAELDAEVQALAQGLLGMGIEVGDRVAIWSTNRLEWLFLQLACARVGAILVNINPAYREAELAHALSLARVNALFFISGFKTSDYHAMLRGLIPELHRQDAWSLKVDSHSDLRQLVMVDGASAQKSSQEMAGILSWEQVIEAGKAVDGKEFERIAARLDPDDPVNIQFTSGTTGSPKAVLLSHHNILNNGYFCAEALGLDEQDRLCMPVPFYHCFGMVVGNLACLSHGAAIVIPAPHFDAHACLVAIASERCTAVYGVPTMFVEMLEHPEFSSFDLSSLRSGIMAGAPCPPALMRRVIDEMGCRDILIGYGQTESSPVTHLTRSDDSLQRRTETVGFNLPHQEVKIVDSETGRTLRRGEQGEVCFRGYHVMLGYYAQAKETREAIDDRGWLHSGDLGVLDADGYLSITGRLKDMIIRGGENIYPAEVEAFFCTHPKVAEIAVFGIQDERLGEEVAAWVMPREGEQLAAEELEEFARGRIARFKVPARFWMVDAFPQTVTGKIQKYRMREIVTEELGLS